MEGCNILLEPLLQYFDKAFYVRRTIQDSGPQTTDTTNLSRLKGKLGMQSSVLGYGRTTPRCFDCGTVLLQLHRLLACAQQRLHSLPNDNATSPSYLQSD